MEGLVLILVLAVAFLVLGAFALTSGVDSRAYDRA
jgi:hypothetical protein